MMPPKDLVIRPLEEPDVAEADRIMRLAFGTFLGVPDPMAIWKGVDYVRTRMRADPSAAFVAQLGSEIVGSNFTTNWGSFGFFGPLTVRPDLWDKGIATQLLKPTMDLFQDWGTKHEGLFTFAQSPKHVSLYQKYGFWPRFLTAIMSKSLGKTPARPGQWSKFSDIPRGDQSQAVGACKELTSSIYGGLDVWREIEAVNSQKLGDTVLLWSDNGSALEGFAVCHCGVGSEAGENSCFVKFGATRSGLENGERFTRLLDSCEAYGAESGATSLVAGVNTSRVEAYRRMMAWGLRTDFQGVAMERPNEPGYNKPDTYVIDDWR